MPAMVTIVFKLIAEDKKLITKLTAEGKTPAEIRDITGLKYATVYNFINKVERSAISQAKRDVKPKPIRTTSADRYVDTGRPMPPVHNSSMTIIVDKNLTELACEQMGLKPPLTTLAERPRSYNLNGWVRVGNKWVAGLPIYNDGMLKCATNKIGRQL